ncbi:MAG TPA: SDR family NAD(P)-dependent oxidoreductase, partial [Polyangiales bacterium]|nr:SDR family NAD(P)-dependent oxidoreductase [Polyangiales bacterium]
GKALFESEPVFRAALQACDEALRPYVDWSLLDELQRRDANDWPIGVIQPSIFAVQVALSALWRSWGVVPSVVVGHSMGEVAAAHVAGVLSLDHAAHIIARRAQNLQDLAGLGGMLAVELPLAEAEQYVERYANLIGVAANNSPEASVLSGDLGALAEVARELRARDVFCRELKVDAAAHSPQLDPLLPAFVSEIAHVTPLADAPIPICSTVTGALLEPSAFTAEYWRRNQREPVRFATAVQHLVQQDHGLFLEIGPHPILRGPLQQIASAAQRSAVTLGSMKRDEPERATILGTLGQLHSLGQSVDLRALYPEPQTFVSLPGYAWQHDAFETLPNFETGTGPGVEQPEGDGEGGTLGEPIRSALHPNTYLWRVPLAPGRSTYLADHVVQAAAVLPGAAYVSMSLTAAAQVFGSEHVALEQLEFATALVLPADATTQLQIALAMEQPGLAQIAFYTASSVTPGAAARWTQHARGRARLLDTVSTDVSIDPQAIAQRCEAVTPEDHFSVATAHGFDYGPAFRGIQQLWTSEREALAKVVLPSSVNFRKGALAIHPAVLDACWQALAGRAWSSTPPNALHLPIAVERVQRWREPGTTVWAHAQLRTAPDAELVIADVQVFDEHGALALETRGFEVRRLDGAADNPSEALYELAWEKQPFLAAVPEREPLAGQRWLVLADREQRVGAELCTLLERCGAECVVAYARSAAGQDTVLDPTDAAAVKAWVAQQAQDATRPLGGVVQLWALDAVRSDAATNAALDEAQALGVVGATHVYQALTACAAPGTKLWLVSAGAQAVAAGDPVEIAQAPLWALGRVLRYEAPELRTCNLDLGPLNGDRARLSAELEAFAREIASEAAADQLALRGEERSVLQLRHAGEGKRKAAAPVESSANYRLGTSAAGVLDNLALYEMERVPPGAGEVEIEVAYAGLNFIDVMKALGIYPGMGDGPVEFGRECAGTITAVGPGVSGLSVGQRVVAMLSGGTGCFSRFVRCNAPLVAACPERLSLDEAAAIPCVYLTAYYAMLHLGRLARGERVLIHSAAGGVGLAAIELARRAGAEIYATAGSHEKREFLRALGVQHVFDSRSNAFAAEIMSATAGEGVDMVLNSLAGDAIPLSLGLLRDDGRFLEIGKRDIYEDMQLGLSPFKRGLSFSHIDLARLGRDKPQLMGGMLRELMDLLGRGELPALPLTTFPLARAAEAFHHMAQAKHIGKIVFSAVEPKDIPACVQPRSDAPLASADATYLVTGGLGGLGLLAAEWLVAQGARHLVLTGRSAPSAAAREAIARLEAQQAKLRVVACDVGDRAAVAGLVRYISSELPPLRGVIHAAGVLADGLASHLTPQQFAQAMWPKLHGGFNLHRETEALELDFFVLFSSAAATLGSPGQANYAAGNEFLDALAHYRRARGLPALSINWGAWSEAGMAARPDRAGRLAARGMGSITNRLGVILLEHLMRSDRVQTAALPGADFATWCSFYPASATGMLEPLLRETAGRATGQADEATARAEILAADPADRPALLETFMTELVRRVLRIPAGKALDPELPLNRFGVDSLMAIELKNRLEAELGVSVQVSRILLSESLRKFAGELLELLPADARGVPRAAAQAVAPAAAGGGLGRVLETDEAELLSEDYFVAEAGE